MSNEEQLQQESSQYRELEAQFKENFHTSPDKNYNIINKKWLDQWKLKVGYNNTQPTGQNLEKNPNTALLQDKANIVLKYEPVDSHMWNLVLDQNLQEGVDFEIISPTMWNYLSQQYNPQKIILKRKYKLGQQIQRDSAVVNGFKTVNIKLMKIKMSPVFPSCIGKFKGGKQQSLIKGDQYVSRTTKLQDYIELMQRTLQTVTGYHFLKYNSIRFYKCPAGQTFEDIEKLITSELKDASYYDDPVFDLKDAEYLDPTKIETMEDCNIEPDQVVLMDAKEMQKNWCVKNANFPMEGKCEGCYNFKILQFPCDCKKVSYCSEECKKRDEHYHMPKCEKTDSDDERMDAMVRKETSVDGKCGLRNLGNTCFMNSGLQCLSNTQELTDNILNNSYKSDINTDNPLGTKGELTSKFAHLLKRMWFGEQTSHPPFSLKRAIGKFQPQFQGYQQHDSQELITYLLDGMHEDLNRIQKKPYVETEDSHGRPDYVVAKEGWETFKKRNDSIIVDNMYGQYKSQLKCPKCDRVSITFDPYLMVNVSIPQSASKKIQLNYIPSDILWNLQTLDYTYDKSKNQKVSQIFEDPTVTEWIGGKKDLTLDDLVLAVTSTYNFEEPVLDETISLLKKKLKFKKFFIRKILPKEVIPKDERVNVLIHESYKQYSTYSWKRELTPQLNFIFSKRTTCKDIHLFIFELHIGLLKTFPGLENLQETITNEGLEGAYKNVILNEVWVLEFKSNQRYQQNCAYCKSPQCSDCLADYDQKDTVEEWLQSEKDLQIELYVVWKRGFEKNGRVDDLYDDWLKNWTNNKMQIEPKVDDSTAAAQNNGNNEIQTSPQVEYQDNKHQPHITLQECLKFSSNPEQLEADNSWYCKQCQDHVQAFKTMEIYKVPKILIFHLKRFKNSNKYFKSKLETVIDFPLEGLDMRNQVLNSHLPQEYQFEDLNQPIKNGPLYYDLYAISNHFGGLGGGHYTAYAKNKYDNSWYNFDDSCVSKVNDPQSQLISSAAYILFYRRR